MFAAHVAQCRAYRLVFGDDVGHQFLGDLLGILLVDSPKRRNEGAKLSRQEGIGPAAHVAQHAGCGTDFAGVEEDHCAEAFAEQYPLSHDFDRRQVGAILELDERRAGRICRKSAVAGEVEEGDRFRGRFLQKCE